MHFFRTNNIVLVVSQNLESTVQRAFGRGSNGKSLPSSVSSSMILPSKDSFVKTRIQNDKYKKTLPFQDYSTFEILDSITTNVLTKKKTNRGVNKTPTKAITKQSAQKQKLAGSDRLRFLTQDFPSLSSERHKQILNKEKRLNKSGLSLRKKQLVQSDQRLNFFLETKKQKKAKQNKKTPLTKKDKSQIVHKVIPKMIQCLSNKLLMGEIIRQLNLMGNIGLKNSTGVSCYKNASFQCLLKTPLIMIKGVSSLLPLPTNHYQPNILPLKGYSESKDYQAQLNIKNPILSNNYSTTDQQFDVENTLRNFSQSSISLQSSKDTASLDLNCEIRLVEFFESLVDKYRSADESGVVDPQFVDRALRSICPVFGLKRQQDAHEFITFIIDALAEETKDLNNHSFVSDLFAGQLEISLTCHKCNKSVYLTEVIRNISLPLAIEEQTYKKQPKNSQYLTMQKMQGNSGYNKNKNKITNMKKNNNMNNNLNNHNHNNNNNKNNNNKKNNNKNNNKNYKNMNKNNNRENMKKKNKLKKNLQRERNKKDKNKNTDKGANKNNLFKKKKIKSIKLLDCFKKFFHENLLQDENSVWCSKCKQKTIHSHQYKFDVFPKILIVHLLRFDDNFKKNNIRCSFPIKDLDINFTMKKQNILKTNDNKNKNKYNLIGVIQHYGTTLFGHYKSITFDRKTNEFYSFNDSIVKVVKNSKKIFENAYILFYERQEIIF
ncbi:ubiquitin carboxyl-terminal hydrolase [Anaeramoeba flamelloides]|uniref:Ubiquitin carboxyl-terminal hydrolase n=1 Tax=Anaeramoeba flamelloides TaxID=1746091 RepID=A0ABQ8YEY9_9EUKA|nr:ubiquitin carboxyl-terminal hydrolase [Anaeramoeba flamelloides]